MCVYTRPEFADFLSLLCLHLCNSSPADPSLNSFTAAAGILFVMSLCSFCGGYGLIGSLILWFRRSQTSEERRARIDLSSHRRRKREQSSRMSFCRPIAPLLDNNYRFNAAAEQTDHINHNKLEFDDGVRAACRCRFYRLLTEQVTWKSQAYRKGFVQRVQLCKFANPSVSWGHIKVIYRLTVCTETESWPHTVSFAAVARRKIFWVLWLHFKSCISLVLTWIDPSKNIFGVFHVLSSRLWMIFFVCVWFFFFPQSDSVHAAKTIATL